MVGTGVTLASGLLALGAILAAPVTGGSSVAAALTYTGYAAATAGAATNFIGSEVVKDKMRKVSKKAHDAFVIDNDRQRLLFEEFDRFEEYCSRRAFEMDNLEDSVTGEQLVFIANCTAISEMAFRCYKSDPLLYEQWK